MKKFFATFLTLFLIISCSITPPNPYTQFYTANTNLDEDLLPTEEVELRTVSFEQFEDLYNQLITENYQVVGTSNFNGSIYDKTFATDQAKSVGAELVLVAQKFSDTSTYTSSVVRYGYGVAPITSTQRRYDQSATFFVKRLKKMKFGVYFNLLTTKEKQENATNYGLKVITVVNDHPMFYAGVIPGDILLEMDGKKLVTIEDFFDDDNQTLFKILRNNKTIEIKVTTGE